MITFQGNFYNWQKMMRSLDRLLKEQKRFRILKEEMIMNSTKVGRRLRDLGHLLTKDTNVDYFKI